MVTFSAHVLDLNLAPSVSAFTAADIPDASTYSKESPHWVANYFLNCTLRAAFSSPMHAYAYNYLRRAQHAFAEHQMARSCTLDFLASGGQSLRRYVDALYHWECFLGQSWHAFALLVKAWEGRAFEKNDGSVEQRLNALYNQMKHVESRIENGQMAPDATVPVWLENQGLRSVDEHLSFAETADILRELAKYADALMDPLTAKQKLNEADV
jgi:hypothetical protein